MSKEEPSQLPADIKDSAVTLQGQIKRNGEWLNAIRGRLSAIRSTDDPAQAYAALEMACAEVGHAISNQIDMGSEAQKLLTWIKVGQMPLIGVVATKKPDPAPVARQQELPLPSRERWTREEVVNARRCSGEKGDEE